MVYFFMTAHNAVWTLFKSAAEAGALYSRRHARKLGDYDCLRYWSVKLYTLFKIEDTENHSLSSVAPSYNKYRGVPPIGRVFTMQTNSDRT